MRRNGRYWLNSFPLELLGQIGTPRLAQTILNKMLGSPVSLEAPFKFMPLCLFHFIPITSWGTVPLVWLAYPISVRGVAQPTFRRIKQFLAVVSSGQTLPLKNATLKAFHDRFEGLMAVLSLARICWDPQFRSSFMLYTFVLFEVNRDVRWHCSANQLIFYLICMIFSSYSSLERDCPTRSLRMLPQFFSHLIE